jgi:hypothetical protein
MPSGGGHIINAQQLAHDGDKRDLGLFARIAALTVLSP